MAAVSSAGSKTANLSVVTFGGEETKPHDLTHLMQTPSASIAMPKTKETNKDSIEHGK